jgi:hippurate hydrolase
MWKIWIVAVAAMMVAGADGARADSLSNSVRADLPSLLYLYHDLHRHPELSGKETRTAALLAEQMGVLGFKVTTGVGGTGVVAVMEKRFRSGHPAADGHGCAARQRGDRRFLCQRRAGVMHACGHDIHMASWIGAARRLSSMKGLWSGTLVMIAQPAEETGSGAKAMLEDGLFTPLPQARSRDRVSRCGGYACGDDRLFAGQHLCQCRFRGYSRARCGRAWRLSA